MIKLILIIAVLLLVLFLVKNIPSENRKKLPLMVIGVAAIGLAFLVLPRLGLNPLIVLQKIMQLMPFLKGIIPL
tara:strand:- start:251 stop:472 length:222 start_codon:yes stop_codon:yes gene_type:complete